MNAIGQSCGTRMAMLVALLLCMVGASPAAAQSDERVAFTGCRIIAEAGASAIAHGVLVMRGNRIESVGPSARVRPPRGAKRIPCAGGTLLPAFWNSHVHLMEPHWQDAARKPAEELSAGLQAMLSRFGFAHAVDTGSDLANTLAVKTRIDSGEVAGPAIIAAGSPFVAPNGTPFYITGFKLPELSSPEQARQAVAANIAAGAGAIKLMSVSLTRSQPFPALPVETIRAVSEEAHRAKLKVLVHPTDRRGVELALAGGADVLLHTAPIGGPWDEEFAARIARAGVALVPTFKLWAFEAARANDPGMAANFAALAQQQVAAFRKAGGRILFGTDVGYMTDYDPAEEYAQMARAGMSAGDILAALTVNPVALFGTPAGQGRLAPGHEADVVLLAGDPDSDVRNFADVRMTWRAGRLLYDKEGSAASPASIPKP